MARAKLANLYAEASGGFGPWVVAKSKSGTVVRKRAVYRRPVSAGQKAQAERLREAAALWSSLEPAEAQAWNAYARGLRRRNPVNARLYSPSGFNTFSGYTMTLLHLDPESEIPALPPEGSFEPGWVNVVGAGGVGEALFLSDGPNLAEVATELLIQPMASPRRTPTKQYRTAAFVRFADGRLTYAAPCEAGTYALGYRLVDATAGRVGPTHRLGIVTVT